MTALQSFYDLFDTLNQIRQREFNHNDFVMLSNHLQHIDIDTSNFTSAQKRELLSQVVAKFTQEYKTLHQAFKDAGLDLQEGGMADDGGVNSLLNDSIDFSTCPPKDLDKHIQTLQYMMENHVQQCKKLAVFKHAASTAKQVAALYEEIVGNISLLTLEDFNQNSEDSQQTGPMLKVKLAQSRIDSFINDLLPLNTPSGADETTVCKHVMKALETTSLASSVTQFDNIYSSDRAKPLLQAGIKAYITNELKKKLEKLTEAQQQRVNLEQSEDIGRTTIKQAQEKQWNQFIQSNQKIIENDKQNKERKVAEQLEKVKTLVTGYLNSTENDKIFDETLKNQLYEAMEELHRLDATKVQAVSAFIKQDNTIQKTIKKLGVIHNNQQFSLPDTFYRWGGDVETAHKYKKKEATEKAEKVTAIFKEIETAVIKTSWEYIKTPDPLQDQQLGQTQGWHLTITNGPKKGYTIEKVIQELSNDIPHRIAELLAPFKNSATTGSSDFFE